MHVWIVVALWLSEVVITSADQWLLSGRSRRIGGAENKHVGGVVAERDAVFFEGQDKAAAQLAEDAIALIGADADLDGVGDGAAFDLVDAEDDWVGDGDVFEGGVVADIVGDFTKDGDDFVGIGAGVDRDLEGGDGVVAGEVGDGGDLAVGDDVESAVGVAEGGAAEGKVFDGAFEAGEIDELADVVLVFNEDEDSIEHVFEDRLSAQADAHANDACGGEDGLVGDVEDIEDLKEGDEPEDSVGGGSEDGRHGAHLGGTVKVVHQVVGSAAQASNEEEDDALKDEDDDEDDDDLRELVLKKEDDVVMPVLFNNFDNTGVVILRGHSQKVHDYDVSLSDFQDGI